MFDDCIFCSLGEKWGIVKGDHMLSDEVIIDLVRGVLSDGMFQFTLRTTEFYDLGRLCELGRKVRKEIPGRFIMVANTGS